MKVAFVHPDLGIGGAERLVVDCTLALKRRGHQVSIITAHHDRNHCFAETRDNDVLRVIAVGDWLPRSVGGYCYALCAYIRIMYATLYLVLFSDLAPHVIFCDQISACIPLVCLLNYILVKTTKIIFYCHFPDQLLTQRTSVLKKIYRYPLDWLEEWSTGLADCILVNSKFTSGIFAETFTSLQDRKPRVLYPSLNTDFFDQPIERLERGVIPDTAFTTFLSINRYERKKNLPLALHALAALRDSIGSDWTSVHLVMAGGYDSRVTENMEHLEELTKLARDLQLTDHVTFLRSPSDAEKRTLLRTCSCLLYTPSNEHFGIVPLEAMYSECPVIAVKSGGPMETVVDGGTGEGCDQITVSGKQDGGTAPTGFLCEPTPEAFAAAMKTIVKKPSLRTTLGKAGRSRVLNHFSFAAFTEHLDSIVCEQLF